MSNKSFNFLKSVLIVFVIFTLERSVSPASVSSSSLYDTIIKRKSIPYEDCGSRWVIHELQIENCTSIPCLMPRGSIVEVRVLFDDNGVDTDILLKHRVRWILLAIKTDATINPDPCNGKHECMRDNVDGKSYTAYIYVNNSLPTINGEMLWEVLDDQNKNVICFKVPIKIVG